VKPIVDNFDDRFFLLVKKTLGGRCDAIFRNLTKIIQRKNAFMNYCI